MNGIDRKSTTCPGDGSGTRHLARKANAARRSARVGIDQGNVYKNL